MNPKEKALELIKQFSPLVTTWNCYWDTPRDEDEVIKDAKQCALILVNETESELKRIDVKFNLGMEGTLQFWKDVKNELIETP
jgi:hypothetical protein